MILYFHYFFKIYLRELYAILIPLQPHKWRLHGYSVIVLGVYYIGTTGMNRIRYKTS